MGWGGVERWLMRALGRERVTPAVAGPPAAEAGTERPARLDAGRVPGVDPLTGLADRRVCEEALAAHRAGRRRGWVVFLDIDHFKTYNDRFGHQVGDHILRTIARRLQAVAPADALVGRVGGEEFLVIVADMDAGAARRAAERLREAARAPLEVEGVVHVVTVSAGVARSGDVPPHASIARADRCLYAAKSQGRDRVVTEDELDTRAAGRYDPAQQFRQMQDQRDAMAVLAVTDDLTGLRNRRAYDAGLAELHADSVRQGIPYAVLYMDLDRFHALNRARGDEAGDQALRACARALVDACRTTADVVYRKGGEELVALLPETSLREALVIGERMRRAVIAAAVPYTDEPGSKVVTISGGVAVFDRRRPRSADDVVGAANRAMVRAKEDGRNRFLAESDGGAGATVA